MYNRIIALKILHLCLLGVDLLGSTPPPPLKSGQNIPVFQYTYICVGP